MIAGVSNPRSYHRLSVSEKQSRSRLAMYEPPIACPYCDTQTTVADLLRHVDSRCPSSSEIHPLSRWLSRREVFELGVPRHLLRRWVAKGLVRVRDHRKRYLQRDLVRLVALRRRPV